MPISISLIELSIGVSLFFFLGRLLVCKGLFLRIYEKEKMLLLFFVPLAFSLVNSGALIPISLFALFFKWSKYIILYLMISQTFTDARKIEYAFASISLGAALVILDCYSQLLFNFEFFYHHHMAPHENNIFALTGPFSHNNDLAAYLICALFIIMYWIGPQKNKYIRIMAAALLLSGIFILPLTYSRGAYLSFMLGVALLLFILKRPLVSGFFLIVATIVGLKVYFLKSLMSKDAGRFELWDTSMRMIKNHPFIGNGLGTFTAVFKNFSSSGRIKFAHNCFLQLWAEAGMVAVAIFTLFVVKTLITGFLSYKETKDPKLIILICALTAYLCHSLFDTNLFSVKLAVLFWVLMGLLKGSILSMPNPAAQK